MIVVSGTKRSGTSLWMQILAAADIPIIGVKFPGSWEQRIRDANPEGFYESPWRMGIHDRTNPDPTTGARVVASRVQGHAIKIFVPGLLKTDVSYLGHVLASMRDWRSYRRSRARMHALEDAARLAEDPSFEVPPRMPAVLEWWSENYTLLCDSLRRRYPLRLESFDGLLRDPTRVIPGVLEWLGHGGDTEQAVAAVKPQLRTATRDEEPAPDFLAAEDEAVLDELYARTVEGRAVDLPFAKRLEQTNARLVPVMQRELARVRQQWSAQRKAHRND